MKDVFPNFDLSAYWQEPDFLLADLVSFLANKLETELGMTLMSRGAILSGTLVSEREYLATLNTMFKTLARDAVTKAPPQDADSLEDVFGFDDLAEDQYSEDAGDEAEFQASPIRHLHLKDPVLIYPGSTISFTESALPIIRLRLTSIDGWMLGRVQVTHDNDDIPDFGLIQ
jgi:hypothetical protein